MKTLNGLAIKAQADSPGTALTVSGWPTAADKSSGVGKGLNKLLLRRSAK